MRLVCWNLERGGSSSTWTYLLDLKPDLIFVQEAVLPGSIAADFDAAYEISPTRTGKEQRWGTAILARHGISLTPVQITSHVRPWVAETLRRLKAVCVVAEARIGDQELILASVHSPAWPISMPEAIDESDLQDVLLDAYRGTRTVWGADLIWRWLVDEVLPASCIVGGDFNTSVLFDRTWGKGNQETLDRYARAGLVECVRLWHQDAEVTPTYRTVRAGEVKHQIDYVWMPPGLTERIRACSLGPREVFDMELSRHLPIVVEMDF